jgi:hypothetical protein
MAVRIPNTYLTHRIEAPSVPIALVELIVSYNYFTAAAQSFQTDDVRDFTFLPLNLCKLHCRSTESRTLALNLRSQEEPRMARGFNLRGCGATETR